LQRCIDELSGEIIIGKAGLINQKRALRRKDGALCPYVLRERGIPWPKRSIPHASFVGCGMKERRMREFSG
jgi:hypothetical protein